MRLDESNIIDKPSERQPSHPRKFSPTGNSKLERQLRTQISCETPLLKIESPADPQINHGAYTDSESDSQQDVNI